MYQVVLIYVGLAGRIRTYLKIIFCPKLGVGSSLQVLDILEYACGLKFGSALI